MSYLLSLGVVLLEVAACVGAGASMLRLVRLLPDRPTSEWAAWSFALGFGILGWLMFFVGWLGGFSRLPLAVSLLILASGIMFLRGWSLSPLRLASWSEKLLAALLIVVAACALVQAWAPPADADSMAYHFALPKQFLQAGHLEFVPRAIDGALPLLIEMTYVPALGLGGEHALTLWTAVTNWATAWLLFSILCRYIDPAWALAATSVYLTTPATLYGAVSGQVEVRIAAFSLASAVAVADGLSTGKRAHFLLAGCFAGFFIGSKYLGGLFMIAAGLTSLLRGRRLENAFILGVAATAAGFQWYLWNWLNTGDPIFPFLVSRFGIGDTSLWPADYYDWFKRGFFEAERAVPISLYWFLRYPFQATFAGDQVFESGRTGLGPFIVLLFPTVLIAFAKYPKHVGRSALLPVALIVVAFYALWFFTGSSQRIRHTLPIYPATIVAAMVAALHWSKRVGLTRPLATAIALCLLIQLGGQAVVAQNYFRYLFSGESRDEFLTRNLAGYNAVMWINNNLGQSDRVFTTERHLIYLFDVPVKYGHIYFDPSIDLRPNTKPEVQLRQLHRAGIDYWLVTQHGANISAFQRRDCLHLVRDFESRILLSRTLRQESAPELFSLYRLDPACPAFMDDERPRSG